MYQNYVLVLYMVSEFFELLQSPNNHYMMDMLSGAVPRMDWEAQDLECTWKTFKQHADFMFSGPLKLHYKPGKTMNLADTLSRSYLSETKENLVPDVAVKDIHSISYLPVSPSKYEEVKRATTKDAGL